MRAIVLGLLVLMAIAVNVCALYAAGGSDDKPTAADVDALVRQLGSPKFRDRQNAQKKLQDMGPGVVKLLEPYREHADAEVRTRVQVILAEYVWRQRGALIYRIEKGSQAEKLGIQVGDVLARIEDFDVTEDTDVSKLHDDEADQTLHFLRGGKVVSVKIKPGRIGIWSIDWDAAKGGDEQAWGYQALAKRDYATAQKLLQQSVDKGLESAGGLVWAAAAADRNLDHEAAWKIYTTYLKQASIEEYSIIRSYAMDTEDFQLPVSSCLADWIVRQLDTEEYTPGLAYYAENVFTAAGANFDLASELSQRELPVPEPRSADQYDRRSRIAFVDGRMEDVVQLEHQFRGQLSGYHDTSYLACRALIRLGRLDEAAELLDRQNDTCCSYHNNRRSLALGEMMAAALASGDGKLAARVFNTLARDEDDTLFNLVFWGTPLNGLCLRPYADRMIDRLNDYFAEHPACNWAALHLLYLYAYVPNEVDVPVDRLYQRAVKVFEPYAKEHYAVWLLRNGRWAAAEAFVKKEFQTDEKDWKFRGAIDRAIAFQRDNAERLKGEWRELAGVTFIYGGPDGGTFAMKSTGEIYFIDSAGKVHPTTGADPDMLPNQAMGDIISTQPTGTLYIHRHEIYLFDKDKLRWLPTGLSFDQYASIEWAFAWPAGPTLAKYVLDKYGPAKGQERILSWVDRSAGGWVLWNLWGDNYIAMNEETGKIVNVSEEIARQLGRDKPVRAFRGQHTSAQRFLIPTEAGLWAMDMDGKLERIEMPLTSNDVICRVNKWPETPGMVYIGVAPQDGGQIIEYDIAQGTCKLTGGFNGAGSDDCRSYAYTRWFYTGSGYAIMRYGAQRRAAKQAEQLVGWGRASRQAQRRPTFSDSPIAALLTPPTKGGAPAFGLCPSLPLAIGPRHRVPSRIVSIVIARAQAKAARHALRQRRGVAATDDWLEDALGFSPE